MAVIIGTEGYSGGAYELPNSKEQGNSVFDKLETFMERMANHQHTGADSRSITLNIEKGVQQLQNITDYVWDPIIGFPDKFRATIDVVAGATFDDNVRTYYYMDAGVPKIFYPSIEKIDNLSYYIISNDNTLDIKVVTI